NGVVIIGSPNTVREKMAEYQDLAGFNTSLTKTQFGTLPDDMTRANMQAVAQEILPHFRDRAPQMRGPGFFAEVTRVPGLQRTTKGCCAAPGTRCRGVMR